MKMRENIGLYRGKRKDNGEWISGYLFSVWETTYICWGTTNGIPNMEEVVPETVGQFFGANDKNRRKIFEGDIVKFKNELFEVKFIEKYSRFAGVKPGVVFSVFLFSNSEIVGNIHDNPELLKGGNEGD